MQEALAARIKLAVMEILGGKVTMSYDRQTFFALVEEYYLTTGRIEEIETYLGRGDELLPGLRLFSWRIIPNGQLFMYFAKAD